MNVVNTLPCEIGIISHLNNLQIINSTENFVFYNIPVHERTAYTFFIYSAEKCGNRRLSVSELKINITLTEYQVIPLYNNYFC